jgi:hypothetical protein
MKVELFSKDGKPVAGVSGSVADRDLGNLGVGKRLAQDEPANRGHQR